MDGVTIPQAVFVIWWIGLIITLVAFVPTAVVLLHRTWRAARAIQINAADALVAAQGIAGNTAQIGALDDTISVAGQILQVAGHVDKKLDTTASVLASRVQ